MYFKFVLPGRDIVESCPPKEASIHFHTFWCKQRGMLRTLGVAGVGMALLGTLSSTMAFTSPAMAGFRPLQLAQTTQRQCRGPACAPQRRSVLPLQAMMDPATVRGPQHHNRRAPLACLFLHVRLLCCRCQLRCLRMPHAVGSSCFRGAGSSSGLALGSGAPCCHLPGTSCHPSHADSSILLRVNVAKKKGYPCLAVVVWSTCCGYARAA